MESCSDGSYDFLLSEAETSNDCTQTSSISEEQETLLKMHINYHVEMKKFLKICLIKGRTEELLHQALSTSLKETLRGKLKVLEMHTYLQFKLFNKTLPVLSLDLSDPENWETFLFRTDYNNNP